MVLTHYLIHKLTGRCPWHEETRHVVWYAIRDRTIKTLGIYEASLGIRQEIETNNQPGSVKVKGGGLELCEDETRVRDK